jgi:DNA mismatch endonuclease (patch repair protein)
VTVPRGPGAELHRVVEGHRIRFDRETSNRLRRVRRHGTEAELLVRAALSARGVRYRVQNQDLPGSPDLANRSAGWSVFVHGCYWHRHPGCRRATTPKRNAEFWQAKFDTNVIRDRRVKRELVGLGYRVLTIWECEAEDARKLARALTHLLGSQ